MKAWVKNIMRKQKQQQRRRVDVHVLADQGNFKITDPLDWSNLIAERVGYARYLANKKNEELDTAATHKLMAGVIKEVQAEILSSPDILAFYLSRLEADDMQRSFEAYTEMTDQY
ncbi:MAG: hypothetical protein GTO41_27900, partial [Burkholderiales bacterium]|nr:hypothetical protein [Burkholderiales bacterium]